MKMRYRIFAVGLLLIMMSLAGTHITTAVTVNDGGIFVDCNGATFNGSITYTRNNAGINQETVQFISFDGAGNIMSFGQLSDTVGGTQPISGTYLDTAPQFNPLTVQIVSIAGNGLDEQIAFSASGTCPGLPTFIPPDDGSGGVGGPVATNVYDGRVNNSQQLDVGAPVAIYCDEDAIEVYKIDLETGNGNRVIYYARNRGLPLPVQGDNVTLGQLETGEYQVNAYYQRDSKPYSVLWTDCSSRTLVHLAF